jgi:hypothetical protein
MITLPRERYIIHASGARLALWFRNSTIYIGGHCSLRQLVEDIFAIGFLREPPLWRSTSQPGKCRCSDRITGSNFKAGLQRLRDSGSVVIEGPVKRLGRIAI